MSHFSFLCRTKTGFGFNALEHLGFDLRAMGAQKPLVIQDKAAHLAGLTKILIHAFKESGMTLGICPPLSSDTKTHAQFIRSLYTLYTEKGFDSIIALGNEPVADMAKALNMAVTLGPDSLKQGEISEPLNPWVYLPIGMEIGRATSGMACFNGQTYSSPFLAPDLAVIDPTLLIPDNFDTIIDSGLTSLTIACEVHGLSQNPPARAYAATIIQLVMENLVPLVEESAEFAGVEKSDTKQARKNRQNRQASLVQAGVMTGYLLSNHTPMLGMVLAQALADHCKPSQGELMAVLLPSILEYNSPQDLGNLLLPLTGQEESSGVPLAQQPGMALQTIRSLTNTLYRLSQGKIPRTLEDAGMDKSQIQALVQEIGKANEPIASELVSNILTHAFAGRPVQRDSQRV